MHLKDITDRQITVIDLKHVLRSLVVKMISHFIIFNNYKHEIIENKAPHGQIKL